MFLSPFAKGPRLQKPCHLATKQQNVFPPEILSLIRLKTTAQERDGFTPFALASEISPQAELTETELISTNTHMK
jgi:hypothetical protein